MREPAAAEKFVAQEVFGFNGQPSEHGRIGILGLIARYAPCSNSI